MGTTLQRWRAPADDLGRRVDGVPPGRWDDPAPCEGWVGSDVVRHLVEWMPSLSSPAVDLPVPVVPSVDDDPVAAWRATDAAISALLADPDLAARPTSRPMSPGAGGGRTGVDTEEEPWVSC